MRIDGLLVKEQPGRRNVPKGIPSEPASETNRAAEKKQVIAPRGEPLLNQHRRDRQKSLNDRVLLLPHGGRQCPNVTGHFISSPRP